MRRHTALLTLSALALPFALAQDSAVRGSYLLQAALTLPPDGRPIPTTLTVYLNGHPFKLDTRNEPAKFRTELRQDITRYLKPGRNEMRVVVSRLAQEVGEVEVAYARDPGQYRTLFAYNVNSLNTPPHFDHTFTLVADGPKGAGRVSTGSAYDQTVLKTNLMETLVARVSVNGQDIGDYAGLTSRDISSYVRPGPNTVTVKWRKPYGKGTPTGSIELAYAVQKNAFRTLFSWHTPLSAPSRGEKTFTVNVPSRR